MAAGLVIVLDPISRGRTMARDGLPVRRQRVSNPENERLLAGLVIAAAGRCR